MTLDNKLLTKEKLLAEIANGNLPNEYIPEDIGQGCGYKADVLFENVPNDIVIYIPEYGYTEGENPTPIKDCIYTKADFINICNGNEKLAEELFEDVDWSFPETLWDEWQEFAD